MQILLHSPLHFSLRSHWFRSVFNKLFTKKQDQLKTCQRTDVYCWHSWGLAWVTHNLSEPVCRYRTLHSTVLLTKIRNLMKCPFSQSRKQCCTTTRIKSPIMCWLITGWMRLTSKETNKQKKRAVDTQCQQPFFFFFNLNSHITLCLKNYNLLSNTYLLSTDNKSSSFNVEISCFKGFMLINLA